MKLGLVSACIRVGKDKEALSRAKQALSAMPSASRSLQARPGSVCPHFAMGYVGLTLLSSCGVCVPFLEHQTTLGHCP